MFDLGIMEIVVIFVVALLVFGPQRLPDIARAIGRGLAEVKNAMEGVKTQIDSEIRDVKDIKELKDPIDLKNELFGSESLIKPQETPYNESAMTEAGKTAEPVKTERVMSETGKIRAVKAKAVKNKNSKARKNDKDKGKV
jgi:Tat protein translocase TatB subunit